MKNFTLLFALCIIVINSMAQGVAINETGASPDSSAMLDVSSVNRGLLIPVMDYSQRNAISGPATGLLIFQTDKTPGFYYYNGSSWQLVGNEALTINDLIDGITDGYSVFLGETAGQSDDGGQNRNVALGVGALRNNISGTNNLAVGYNAMNNNSASNNTALGYRALYTNSTGTYNTAAGFQSLYYNSYGRYNTGLGYASLYRNVGGYYNVGIGHYANGNNQGGSKNTMIGYQAGQGGSTLHSKTGSICIGYRAGYNDTTDNKLYIHNSSSSSPLIYGEFDIGLLRVNGTLHVGNAYHFPVADGASGQVLSTDGSGTLAWSTPGTGGGITQLNDLTDAKTGGYSVFLGADAGAADDGSDNRNIALGVDALKAGTTGSYNSASGFQASYNNTTGNYNIVHGAFADYRNLTGSQNVLIGHQAGHSTSYHSKSGNIRIGYQAGKGDTTDNKLYIENSSSSTPLIWGDFANDSLRINGDLVVTGSLSGIMGIDELHDGITIGNSVFLGESAGSSDPGTDTKNTALGYQALMNSTGISNIAIGYKASGNNSTGNYNVEIGSQANANNIGGSKNTVIGYAAGYDFNTHNKSGNVLIGYAAGYGDTTDNKLFIENSTSSAPLVWGDFENDSVVINGDFGITGEWTGIGINDLSDGKADSSSNIYLGRGAGENSNAFADNNVAVGDSALFNVDNSDYNTAVGYKSLYSNQYGQPNTAIGHAAMADNIYGEYNTAVGYKSLFQNHDGNSNSAFGHESLYSNTNGVRNTAVGYLALSSNTGGDFNTAIGYSALTSNIAGGSNVGIGNIALFFNTIGSYNTAVGQYSLFYNTEGNQNTAVGSNSLQQNTLGTNNTAIGDSSLLNNVTGNYNTAGGSQAMYSNTVGYGNTAFGYKAMESTTTGHQNVAIGDSALAGNTDGNFNTAVGSRALYTSTTVSGNTAIGHEALHENTTGDNNTATGYEALFSNTDGFENTAYGYQALDSNTEGHENTACGHKAMLGTIYGDQNTAFGNQSLYWNLYGSENTAIGAYSGCAQGYSNLYNITTIGSGVQTSNSNWAVLGNSSVVWNGGNVTWSTYSDERVQENIRKDVKGLDFILKLNPVTYHVNKNKLDDIKGIEDHSNYPEKYDIEKIKQSGFLAQEVEQAALESGYDFSGVKAPPNKNTPYSLSYSQFVVPLVKAVQEQQEMIEELKEQNRKLMERFEQLETE